MKINFTKAEYRLLLDLVSLGSWVMTCHDTEEDQRKANHEEVVQKIFSHAKEFGCEKLITYDQTYQKYFETGEFEESLKEEILREYEENTFWDELINRLAERDFIQEHGLEKARAMTFEERIGGIHKHEVKWSEEFMANGIDRINIDASDLPKS